MGFSDKIAEADAVSRAPLIPECEFALLKITGVEEFEFEGDDGLTINFEIVEIEGAPKGFTPGMDVRWVKIAKNRYVGSKKKAYGEMKLALAAGLGTLAGRDVDLSEMDAEEIASCTGEEQLLAGVLVTAVGSKKPGKDYVNVTFRPYLDG